jgi:hypothetical protein
MRLRLPRIFSVILLPLLLLVACTQVSGGRRGEARTLVLEVHRGESAAEHLGGYSPARPEYGISIGSRDKLAPREPSDLSDNLSGTGALTFAVVSDLNGSYGSITYGEEVHETVRWLRDEVRPDLVVSTGDMVAGQRPGLDYEAMWAGFHAAVTEPLAAAGIPLAVTPGNHDASAGDYYIEERITFVEQWERHRPAVEFVDDRFYPLHYAFKARGVLFVSLDATLVGPIDEAQRRWLRGVLSANADARVTVVYGHIPLYPFSQGRENEILNDPELEAMLNEFGVDLMLSGHHHAYYPGRRGDLRLVSMACLGSGPRALVGSEEASSKGVVVVHVSENGELTLDGFRAGDHSKIEREALPEKLNSGEMRIWRDDLERRSFPTGTLNRPTGSLSSPTGTT